MTLPDLARDENGPAPVPRTARQHAVRMRDGIRLATDVYLPSGEGPFPGVVLVHEAFGLDEAARGTGAGKALFRALAQEAVAQDCARVDWAVLDWNESAMEFYRAIGGRPQTGWQPWRLDKAAIRTLAA